MKTGVRVGDIMTRDFVFVNPNVSIKECAEMMIKKKVGSLALKENGKLKGLITERDIVWAMTKKSIKELEKIKAGDLAKKKIITIKPSTDLYEALGKMRKSKYRWLPVVANGNAVGFLTLKDILKVEPSLFEIAQAHRIFEIREEDEKIKRRKMRQGAGEATENMCEECGTFNSVYKQDGRLICGKCRDAM